MPPDGYDTVTLPNALVQRLEEMDGDSHTATIRMLLAERKRSDSSDPEADDSEIAREVARQLDYTAIADKVSQQVVRELQG